MISIDQNFKEKHLELTEHYENLQTMMEKQVDQDKCRLLGDVFLRIAIGTVSQADLKKQELETIRKMIISLAPGHPGAPDVLPNEQREILQNMIIDYGAQKENVFNKAAFMKILGVQEKQSRTELSTLEQARFQDPFEAAIVAKMLENFRREYEFIRAKYDDDWDGFLDVPVQNIDLGKMRGDITSLYSSSLALIENRICGDDAANVFYSLEVMDELAKQAGLDPKRLVINTSNVTHSDIHSFLDRRRDNIIFVHSDDDNSPS